jgi:hypothetical protein
MSDQNPIEAFKARLREVLQHRTHLEAAIEQRDADWAVVANRLGEQLETALLERDRARSALRALVNAQMSPSDAERMRAYETARALLASWDAEGREP